MKNAAIYMRVNRNLDIRNQEMEEYLNACDNLVSFSKLFGGVFVSLFGDKFRF